MARILETLPGSTWNEEFSAKRIASQVGSGGTAAVAASIVAQRLKQKISRNAPVDTGQLKESVKTRIILGGPDPRVNVKTVVHGAYQEHGTTVLAPTHFMSEIVRGERAAWEADIKATKATLDRKVAAAEKKEKGGGTGQMNITVAIEGMDFFATMTNQAQDFRKPLFERVVPIFHKVRAEQFDAEAAYVSGSLVKWAPFKVKPKGTSRGAGGRFTTRKLLNKTGRTRRAMTTHSAPATIEVGSDYLTFRSHIPYEVYHQLGTSRMPARPITFDKPKAQEEAQRELLAWVVEPVDPAAAQSARRGA